MRSIMQEKNGQCYLCMKLNNDYSIRHGLHEHHAIYGRGLRALSEKWGLKVYLCVEHHISGKAAVHNNVELSTMLKQDAQRAFEKHYPEEDFMKIFGRNYK